ncbi:MAG: MoxR family ATPase [Bacteroidota bacterium]
MAIDLYKPDHPQPLPPLQLNAKLFDPSLYEVDPALQDAINIALQFGLPLLLTGEPGTGKTQLAHHLAWHFDVGEALVFNARTTSTATDLFYRYDSLGHFQYAQNQQQALQPEEIEEKFIYYEALGAAIMDQQRRVVLIDEIDKAPRDLPNDILAAVERMSFEIPELNKTGTHAIKSTPENRPILILTSNSEKNLPDAFLRRVAYYHIPFPSETLLADILNKKQLGIEIDQLKVLIKHFLQLRESRKYPLKKNPATAELIFWALALKEMTFPIHKLKDMGLSVEEKKRLLSSYTVIAKNKDDYKALAKSLGLNV